MKQVHIIGIDLVKQGFQLHGARPDGSVAFRKKLTRGKVLDFLALIGQRDVRRLLLMGAMTVVR